MDVLGIADGNYFFTKENYVKYHENYDWMKSQYVDQQKTPKEIGKSLHISYKLVIVWLKKHNLYVEPKDLYWLV